MELRHWTHRLQMAHTWTIARGVTTGGEKTSDVVLVQISNAAGVSGVGESAPIRRYGEDISTVAAFLQKIDARRLAFENVPASMAYLDSLATGQHAAKCAVNIALLDGAARLAGQPVYDLLGLGFRENQHVTSFTIGIDTPAKIRQKVTEAEPFPVLKLKVGGPDDQQNLAALREAAPHKPVRVDANEGWKTKEEALRNLEWLAADGHIQFVEQPMPASTPPEDLAWLKERSPLEFMADESFHSAADVARCAGLYHSVNVKLVKTAGISGALAALQAARKAGLKTMIGCMIETSVLITAAAHLAELTDYLDIDGNILTKNDPFIGVTADRGRISFATTPEKLGLRVSAR